MRHIGEICIIQPPKSEARARLKPHDAVSFVPMECLRTGTKSLSLNDNRTLAEVSGSYTYFADGDVLLAKITPCFENGKLGIAAGLTNGVGFGSSEYIVLRPSAYLKADFLYYFLAQSSFRETAAKNMTGTAGQKRVTKTYVESQTMPVPPMLEQERIVAILDQANREIASAKRAQEEKLAALAALKQSLLHQAFSGNL